VVRAVGSCTTWAKKTTLMKKRTRSKDEAHGFLGWWRIGIMNFIDE
jgi:hypothetical protein